MINIWKQGKDHLCIKKKSGPRMEPCDTPHFICSKFVDFCLLKLSLYSIHGFPFERKLLNHNKFITISTTFLIFY